jgi:hypothetical protein
MKQYYTITNYSNLTTCAPLEQGAVINTLPLIPISAAAFNCIDEIRKNMQQEAKKNITIASATALSALSLSF